MGNKRSNHVQDMVSINFTYQITSVMILCYKIKCLLGSNFLQQEVSRFVWMTVLTRVKSSLLLFTFAFLAHPPLSNPLILQPPSLSYVSSSFSSSPLPPPSIASSRRSRPKHQVNHNLPKNSHKNRTLQNQFP